MATAQIQREELANEGISVIVNYVPDSVTQSGLERLFHRFHPISVKLVVDRMRKSSLGYAFITFATKDEANTCIEAMNGLVIENKRLKVTFAKPREEVRFNTNTYIAGLPPNYTDGMFFALCSRLGEVVEHRLMPPQAGHHTLSGFARYARRLEAEAAVACLNGLPVTAEGPLVDVMRPELRMDARVYQEEPGVYILTCRYASDARTRQKERAGVWFPSGPQQHPPPEAFNPMYMYNPPVMPGYPPSFTDQYGQYMYLPAPQHAPYPRPPVPPLNPSAGSRIAQPRDYPTATTYRQVGPYDAGPPNPRLAVPEQASQYLISSRDNVVMNVKPGVDGGKPEALLKAQRTAQLAEGDPGSQADVRAGAMAPKPMAPTARADIENMATIREPVIRYQSTARTDMSSFAPTARPWGGDDADLVTDRAVDALGQQMSAVTVRDKPYATTLESGAYYSTAAVFQPGFVASITLGRHEPAAKSLSAGPLSIYASSPDLSYSEAAAQPKVQTLSTSQHSQRGPDVHMRRSHSDSYVEQHSALLSDPTAALFDLDSRKLYTTSAATYRPSVAQAQASSPEESWMEETLSTTHWPPQSKTSTSGSEGFGFAQRSPSTAPSFPSLGTHDSSQGVIDSPFVTGRRNSATASEWIADPGYPPVSRPQSELANLGRPAA